MAELTIADGETVTIADGETETASLVNIDGTLNLNGTLNIAPGSLAASAAAGVTVTDTLGAEAALQVAAAAGVTVADTLGAEAGLTTDAAAGLTATPDLDTLVPLRRRTTTTIDNTRRDDFSVQGTGETE